MVEPVTTLCYELKRYVRRRDDGEDPWIGNASLAKSLECGCEYCTLACATVGKGGGVEANKKRNREAAMGNAALTFDQDHASRSTSTASIVPRLTGSGMSFGRDASARELFVLNREDDPVIPIATSISGYTGSDAAHRTAWKWFEDCVKTHKMLCPQLVKPSGPPTLPLRVLEVGPKDAETIRLVDTQGKSGYWACLSHCWGGGQPLQTTRTPDTLSKHLVSIKYEALPKTFREAIFVARRFGIEYLWIDSLCIIQDDNLDWQTQSAQMAYIYQNCILTIAGSASAGPDQGLFRHADTAHVDSPLADTLLHPQRDIVRHRKALAHESAELPLLQRCWVHQERLLSPRFLHFGRHELMWECMETLECECGGARHDHKLEVPKWLAAKAQFEPRMLQTVNWGLGTGPSVWHAVVSDYTAMNLSKPKDIFPAISGLAKSVHSATGWEYVAGLWKENLIVDLVWSTVEPQFATRSEPWRAPSFSWASIKREEDAPGSHRVTYRNVYALRHGLDRAEGRITVTYASLISAKCVPNGLDAYGELSSAYVILQGTLVQATLCAAHSRRPWSIAAYGKAPNDHRDVFHNDFDFAKDPKLEVKAGDEVFGLKLMGSKMKYSDEEYVVWLVLKKALAEDSPPAVTHRYDCQTFERIGLLVSRKDTAHLDDESDLGAIEREVRVMIV